MAVKTVNVKIDGIEIQVPSDYTILKAAYKARIDIPTLCFLKDINEEADCRMCVVEVKGQRGLKAACAFPVFEGMEVLTNTQQIRDSRKVTLELILSNHDRKCLTCVRNQNCELQKLSEQLNVTEIRFQGENHDYPIDISSPSIERDLNKCINCRRCISTCSKVQTVHALASVERGFDTKISTAFDMNIAETPCVNCGQCIINCPVGALRERSNIKDVFRALADSSKHVVVQTAPAVRVAIGDEFGLGTGERATGQLVTSLKQLGFDGVFDTDTGADFTIMEEGTELIQRLESGENLPLITSCSPGWVKFCEHNFPEFIPNLSSAKSPHQMFGALLKTYYARKKGIEPQNIVVVSVMPCTAKKFESAREENQVDKIRDIDYVITTRELAKMLREAGVELDKLKPTLFDKPFGEASGAGVIFGATGGVMEAAIRTVADILSGTRIEKVDYNQVRGTDGIKEASIDIGNKTLKVAVAHGLGNARKLLNRIKSGEASYDFIEMMACPGGCVNGGGQPIHTAKDLVYTDVKQERAAGLYAEDRSLVYRKSHENPVIKNVYAEFLGEPCGHEAHKLLHTHFYQRENY